MDKSIFVVVILAKKATRLQEIELKIRSNTFCQNVIDELVVFSEEKEDFYTNGLFCAGGEYGKDSCSGDSGSAIFSKEQNKVVQIGIVSGAPGAGGECGMEGIPSYYTRVSFYLKWILDNIME